MEKRRIGSLEVSVVGLGCNNFGWRIGAEETKRVVDAAMDAGINFFDTADIYAKGESEQFLSAALGSRRNEIVLATKFGLPMDEQRQGAKPSYIRQAVEDSLRRLNTDHIDLYQLHRPDPATPISETLGALDDLVKEGKVREIGCSNFTAAQIREAEAAARSGGARFVSVQNEYSMLSRGPEPEVLPQCQRSAIAFIPYFPLANGMLTGKYRKGQPLPAGTRGADGWGPKVFTPENLDRVETLIQFAESQGHTLLELAMSWLAAQPAVASIIAGAKSVEQVRQNAAAAGWRLTPEQRHKLHQILNESGQSAARG